MILMSQFRTRKTGRKNVVYPLSGPPHAVTRRVHTAATRAKRHKKTWHVRGHYSMTKAGGRVWIKPHDAKLREKTYREGSKDYERKEIEYGGHYNEVAEKISREYERKGKEGEINPSTGKPYTYADAVQIGKDTAADVYRRKLAKDYA